MTSVENFIGHNIRYYKDTWKRKKKRYFWQTIHYESTNSKCNIEFNTGIFSVTYIGYLNWESLYSNLFKVILIEWSYIRIFTLTSILQCAFRHPCLIVTNGVAFHRVQPWPSFASRSEFFARPGERNTYYSNSKCSWHA